MSCNDSNQANNNNTSPNSANFANQYSYQAYKVDTGKLRAILEATNFKTLVLTPTNTGTAQNQNWTLVASVDVMQGSSPIDATGLLQDCPAGFIKVNRPLIIPGTPNEKRYRISSTDTRQKNFIIALLDNVTTSSPFDIELLPCDGVYHQEPRVKGHLSYSIVFNYDCGSGGGLGFVIDSVAAFQKSEWKWSAKFAHTLAEINPRPPGSDPN